MQERCSDPALSVRKQALQSLTDLLDTFSQNKLIQKSWLDGVSLVLDVESSVQSKCLEVVASTVFSNLVSYDHFSTDDQKMAWSLLNILAEANNVQLCQFFQKICQHCGKTGVLKTLLTAVKSHIATENNAGA